MSSPFPGMDPYLEAHWGDVHTSLVTYARDQLRRQLPPDLKARVVEVENDPTAIAGRESDGPVGRRVEIVGSGTSEQPVTVIAVLRLDDKTSGAGHRRYLERRRDWIEGGVNVVEIDLLRQGEWSVAAPEARVPEIHRGVFRVCTRRASRPSQCEFYPIRLQDPLPVIPIPLRPTEPDATLNLQDLIEKAYENGGYDDIDYRRDPEPPLAPGEAEWAFGLLREKGLR